MPLRERWLVSNGLENCTFGGGEGCLMKAAMPFLALFCFVLFLGIFDGEREDGKQRNKQFLYLKTKRKIVICCRAN